MLGAVNLTLGPELTLRLPERFVAVELVVLQEYVPAGAPTSERSTNSPTPRFVLHKLVGYVASQTFEICITLKGTCTEFVFVQYDGMEFAVFVHVVKLT